MRFLLQLAVLGLVRTVRGDEIDLLGVCDPHSDICVAKYSSCEPFLGNVNGEKYAMVEAKAGLLEVNANSRRCTCLPGFSAVNIGKAVGDSVRLDCVPVEGASCYTDGDCNIRNLDCLPLLSLLPGIFGAVGQLNSDSLFAPGFLTPGTQAIYAFIAGFLQLSTQFLCGFNRVNTIEYKCTYASPSKQDTAFYGGMHGNGQGASLKGGGFGGTCKRVNRNEGYPSASSTSAKGKGSNYMQQASMQGRNYMQQASMQGSNNMQQASMQGSNNMQQASMQGSNNMQQASMPYYNPFGGQAFNGFGGQSFMGYQPTYGAQMPYGSQANYGMYSPSYKTYGYGKKR